MENIATQSIDPYEGEEADRGLVSSPARAVKPMATGWFSSDRFYFFWGKHPERAFVFITLITVVFINVAAPQKISFINFYFLPVIISGYLAGIRTSVTGALLCILLVTLNALIAPEVFSTPVTTLELGFHIMAWGGFLLLAGYAVGHQRDKNKDLKNRERLATVVGLSTLAECRDEATGSHLLRIRSYTELLARSLARTRLYRGYLHENRIGDLLLSCVLHDIGKVAVPDAVLLKQGPLTEQEFALVKLHPEKGRATIEYVPGNG
jgi:HD-GYP domain-containing protein (c-di-GMP phosphodiesterase class II)